MKPSGVPATLRNLVEGVNMSEAVMPLTVPKEFIRPPGRFNPNVWMLLGAFALVLLSSLGYWRWQWLDWCCFSMNVLALHLAGTVIHDASHHAAHPSRVVNAVMGHASALLLGFSFPVFTRVHMQHHAHVNDPKNDPDHFVSTGGPLWMIAARFFYHEIFFFQRRLWRKYELLEWFLARLAVAAIIYAAVQFDFLGYIFNFWFTPALVVGVALGLFFDYLPHRPFQERNRWRNARVYPGRLLNLLIMGQNYHLIHHLWPSIPWYRYQGAYYATKPLLDAKGSPQRLGIFESAQDFWGVVYDTLIGIRFHHGDGVREAKPSADKGEGNGSVSEVPRETGDRELVGAGKRSA
jgi:beta-carotene hydroxylase